MVLKVRAPIKIFGNLNGQFSDLMRYFAHFGMPLDSGTILGGDIDSYDYLFLGDYVDRGSRSVEIILLLFALKLKF
jgi:protein phosphatase